MYIIIPPLFCAVAHSCSAKHRRSKWRSPVDEAGSFFLFFLPFHFPLYPCGIILASRKPRTTGVCTVRRTGVILRRRERESLHQNSARTCSTSLLLLLYHLT